MSAFPDTEPELMALGQDVISGIKAHPEVFANCPVAMEKIVQEQTAYLTARDACASAQVAAVEATANKQDTLDAFSNTLKTVVRYFRASCTDQQMGLIGCAPRAAATPLQVPAQPRSLQSLGHTAGALNLNWKAAQDGGKPATYIVERRELPDGSWGQIATVFAISVDLQDQPRARPLEYRVIAANRSGQSEASNTLTVTL